jgi:2-polyprenyl-3-methyl-5-hydroxy-6-metoxy-1,4-benzoquinol methylase
MTDPENAMTATKVPVDWLADVEVHESLIESLPLEDTSVDVVISNGVIDLVPDKDAVLDEIDTYARSAFEGTRRKAAKFGAMGSTIRATKPR